MAAWWVDCWTEARAAGGRQGARQGESETLQYTLPHDQKVIKVARLSTVSEQIVMDPRHAVTTVEAVQPRKDMGIGMLAWQIRWRPRGQSPYSPPWGPRRTGGHGKGTLPGGSIWAAREVAAARRAV